MLLVEFANSSDEDDFVMDGKEVYEKMLLFKSNSGNVTAVIY